MKNEFLANYLITYIERRIAKIFDTYYIINEFYDTKERAYDLNKSMIQLNC